MASKARVIIPFGFKTVAYVVCPACEGKKGQFWKEDGSFRWRNCHRCKGLGRVKKDSII